MKKSVSWDSMTKDRTVWIGFLRTLVKIGFVLIILAGGLIGLSSLVWIRDVWDLLLGLLLLAAAVAVAVFIAFLVCSVAFIKLDLAEDVHMISQTMEYFLLKSRIKESSNPAENKSGSTEQAVQDAAVPAPNEKPFPGPDPNPEK